MIFKIVNQPLQNRSILNLIISCVNKEDYTVLNFLSKEDYQLIADVVISEETYISSILHNEVILYHFNKYGYYRVNCNEMEKVFIENDYVPEYIWNSGVTLNLDRKKKIYKCLEDNKVVYEFESKYPTSNQWFESGILFFQNNEREKNWIKCVSSKGGQKKWEVEFPWQFIRLETYKNLIVLDYQAYDNLRTDEGNKGKTDWNHPNHYTIVLNGDTGQEIWKLPYAYSKIDYDKGIVLLKNAKDILEVEISSGTVRNRINSNIPMHLNYYPYFTDAHGIYYTTNEGSFGKINKVNGVVLWEFDLIDKKGEKRKLSDWYLLKNGNLVLQAMPNHPNGDLTCIFNPKENMQYSKIYPA